MAREINLQEERDRLVAEMRTIQSEIEKMDLSSDPAQAKVQTGYRLDKRKRGVEWAINEWDVESITVRSLTLGLRAFLKNLGINQQNDPGTYENYQIALGTIDAPYVEHDPDPEELTESEVKKTVRNVGNIDSLAFGEWILAQIDEETAGNWNDDESFAALLLEIQSSTE